MDVVDRGEAHVKGLLSLVKMPEIGPVVAATSTARALQINRDAVRFRMLSALDGDLPLPGEQAAVPGQPRGIARVHGIDTSLDGTEYAGLVGDAEQVPRLASAGLRRVE